MNRRVSLSLVPLAAAWMSMTLPAYSSGHAGAADHSKANPVQLESPAAVIVQFTSPPGVKTGPLARGTRDLERSQLLSDLHRLRSDPDSFRFDYRRVFNGVCLRLSQAEVDQVRRLAYVKGVFDDQPMHATLMDSVPLIGADQVWSQMGVTGVGVPVAVLDTGVNYAHPDLGSCFGPGCKVRGGYDFVNGDGDPMDDHGHGTHVAGIIAANGVVKGVAPGAAILAYKVLDANGSGSSSTIIAALDAALDPDGNPNTDDGAKVINLSLGGYGDPDDPLSQAVDGAVDAGVVVAVAAGNSGPYPQSIGSPGTSRKAITVGATNKQDAIADFSSRGPVIWSGGAIDKPDIVAPGVGICSTRWDGSWAGLECVDQQHVAISGTSMATPHIAGAAALLVQAHPGWTPTEIKMALRNTALDLGYESTTQGHGRVRVLAAALLPHAPPIALIATSGQLTTTTAIRGTATGSQFQSYALFVGEGSSPASWTLLVQSSTPVNNGNLYAGLNPCTLSEGIHTLRLDVTDNDGHVSQDRTFLQVDNLAFSAPLNNDIFRQGDAVELSGSIFCGAGFQNYVIEYGEGHDPAQWSTAGVVLTNGGTVPVVNGRLATWNTGAANSGVYYTLRLTTHDTFGQRQEMVRSVYLDPSLKAGWPQRIPWDFSESVVSLRTTAAVFSFAPNSREARFTRGSSSSSRVRTVSTSSSDFAALTSGFYYWGGYLEPVVADIDGDGRKEIIVYKGGAPPKLTVLRSDGSLMWMAPVGSTGVAGGNLSLPLAADVSGDGLPEVIVYRPEFNGQGHLYVFRSDGSIMPGWPIPLMTDFQATLLAADLDQDGQTEIVVKGNGGVPRKLVIVGSNGQIRSQWNLTEKRWGSSLEGSAAVGDLDGDGQLEIVTADPSEFAGYDPQTGQFNNTGIVNVFRQNGTELPGWPRYTAGVAFSSPAVGDLDHDGRNDIVVGLLHDSFTHDERYDGLIALDCAGNALPHWPVLTGSSLWSSPSLGDLDGDGRLEVVASSLDFLTHVFRYNGSEVGGWPQSTGWADFYSTILGDVDGDGFPDVLTTAGSAIVGGGVYAWRLNGTPIGGFPKITEVDAQGPATLANIDDDGQVELIASSDDDMDLEQHIEKLRGSIYVWDLPAPFAAGTMQWPEVHHDAHHTGYYRPPFGSTSSGWVPDGGLSPGTPLTVEKAPAGAIKLSWGESCSSTDEDYEVYEGALGAFTSHAPKFCSTGAATSKTFQPGSGNRYYLVVPRTAAKEGSYGTQSGGVERPPSASACLPQEIAVVCE